MLEWQAPLPADEEEGGAAEGAEGEASELEDGMPADTAWGVHVSSLDEIDEGLLKRINLDRNKLAGLLENARPQIARAESLMQFSVGAKYP